MVRGLTARCCPRCSTKKRWSSVGKVNLGLASAMPILPNRGGEELEALARDCHEFRDAGQIPIGIGHLGMADIGRKRGHGVVDISPAIMPELHPPADEGMAQVMDAWLVIGASRGPTELFPELLEDVMDGPFREPAPR